MADLTNFIKSLVNEPWTYKVHVAKRKGFDKWSNWITCPDSRYIESENDGPYPFDQIQWIDINPMEKRRDGKLTKEKVIDHTQEVIDLVSRFGLKFEIFEAYLRIIL